MPRENHVKFEVVPFPRMRLPVIDVMRMAHRKHIIHGLLEVDVSLARQLIRDHKARTGERLSFTAFVATCLAKAVDGNKYLHARRDWRGRLVIFDDVDVKTNIEVNVFDHDVVDGGPAARFTQQLKELIERG